ncbi:MAG: pitrilysin family protein [Acidobacteriota bacterium]
MKKVAFLALAISLFVSSLAAAPSEDLTTLVPKREKLLNGLSVLVIERPNSGNVALHIVIKSGTTFDPLGKSGVADLTAQMMLRGGSGGWTGERLKEELSDINARLEITTGWDATELRMLGRSADIDALVNILGRVITQPQFVEQSFEQLKAERIKSLEVAPVPTTLADEAFFNALYGSHPYGHNVIGTKESLAPLTRFDINDFYNRFYLANNSSLIIVGDVSIERMLPSLRKAFGGWRKGNIPPYTFVPPKENPGVNIRLIERADQTTTEIRLGNFTLRRTDSDYLPTQLLVAILNRRLAAHKELKLEAVLAARKLRGPFLVSASVPVKEAPTVLSATLAEIKRLGERIEAAELQAAKDQLIEEYKAGFNANTEIAARWAEVENYNLGSAYVINYTRQVNQISIEDLRRVTKYFSPDNLTIAVLGRARELETELKKFGKLEIAGVNK